MGQERLDVADAAERPVTASTATIPLEDAAFLRAVLEAIPAVVVRIDPDQRISYINHLREGLSLAQVVGRPVSEFVAPDDWSAYVAAVEQALRTGKPCAYVARGTNQVTRTGLARYACHAVPIDNGDGRKAICVVATDVSEDFARAEAQSRSEEKLRVAVEATGIGLWIWDTGTDRIDWDERLIDMVGRKPATAREYLSTCVHPDDREMKLNEREAAAGGRPPFSEYRIVRPDGEIRWLLSSGKPIKDETGRVVRMTGGLIDVTERRRTEEHLRNAQKLEAVGSLTAGVAHNFNNMLAVIVPALDVALRSAAPGHLGLLQDAAHAARRATELVTQLMTFAGQRRSPSLAPHVLSPIVERAVSMCTRAFEHRVRVDTELAAPTANVACDPVAIEQVVVNLLINARDAVLDAGRVDPRITVHLSMASAVPPDLPGEARRRYVELRVSDDGAGMSEAIRQRVFEPFFTTKEPGKGTGLGLSTSYAIVRDHGGFITIESEPGKGTTASVLLPLSQEETLGDAHRRDPENAPARRGKVLVVEDEEAIQRLSKLLLGERGHEVLCVGEGQAAVVALDGGFSPDVILLDRSLPGWSARLTLQEIRRRAVAVPVVLFTGGDVPTEERALVQEVLLKPQSMVGLVHSIERWIPGCTEGAAMRE